MPQPLPPRLQLAVVGWGAMLAIGVNLPFLAAGDLWLLDWVIGPRTPFVPPGAFGLNGGLTSGIPFTLVADWLVRTLGGSATWFPLVLFFPVAAWGISRLVSGSLPCRLGAATFYCVNPFVFERIYVGHLALLLGYALLPFAVMSALSFARSGTWWIPTPALWWAVLTALSPHFAWIYAVVLLAVWITHHPTDAASVRRLIATGAGFALMSAYVLLPHVATQLSTSTRTSSLLALYRTTGDPHLGLFPNVIGLYGFWRLGPSPTLPKDSLSGWPFLLLALLIVAGIGALARLRIARRRPSAEEEYRPSRRMPTALLIMGIAGFFLSLGDQGPTGPVFRWAYFHVPFFAVMEEPQKFLMLTALAYAVFFGWGVERLTQSVGRPHIDRRTMGAASLAVLLPLAYTPTILDGLAGQIAPSQLPASWQTADRLMGEGPGQILFLPWHLYLAFPFTDGRVIANPASNAFRRNVISGDNLEAGVFSNSISPRSDYLEHLFALGSTTNDFGSAVAPLGVQFVVLAKTVDWRAYIWLAAQSDLRLVMNSPTLEIWRNMSYEGVGQFSRKRLILPISPVAYAVGPGTPGWVAIDAPYQKGWEFGGRAARQSPQGTLLFLVGSSGGVARFTPWGLTRLGYIVSGSVILLLSAAVVVDRIRIRGRPRAKQPT